MNFQTHSQIHKPILSVIIPTVGQRPQWLERAVKSAIAGWSTSNIEVLIILNKNIKKENEIVQAFSEVTNVKVITALNHGVSHARNVGLDNAKGILIRFLDDDDYLFPDIAVEQCLSLLDSGADMSSYAITLIDETGIQSTIRYPIEEDDCVIALSLPTRLQIPLSFVFKKSSIQNCLWQENLNLAEDAVWLLNLMSMKELSWARSTKSVGVWFQHTQARLSHRRPTHIASSSVALSLIKLSQNINCNNARKKAIAAGLWRCFIDGFKYNPLKWSNIAKYASVLDYSSAPNSNIYIYSNRFGVSPLLLSWFLLPIFWGLHGLRLLFEKSHLRH